MKDRLKEVSTLIGKTLEEDHSPADKLAFLLSLAAGTREIALDQLSEDENVDKVKQLYELADTGLHQLLEA